MRVSTPTQAKKLFTQDTTPKSPRQAQPATTEDLRDVALGILERRGFDVRGKTTAEVHEIIRRSPTKVK